MFPNNRVAAKLILLIVSEINRVAGKLTLVVSTINGVASQCAKG